MAVIGPLPVDRDLSLGGGRRWRSRLQIPSFCVASTRSTLVGSPASQVGLIGPLGDAHVEARSAQGSLLEGLEQPRALHAASGQPCLSDQAQHTSAALAFLGHSSFPHPPLPDEHRAAGRIPGSCPAALQTDCGRESLPDTAKLCSLRPIFPLPQVAMHLGNADVIFLRH